MSIDTVPKTVEESPVESKPVETTPAPVNNDPISSATPETHSATPALDSTPASHGLKDKTVVEAQPRTEGVLGYKAPGFLKYVILLPLLCSQADALSPGSSFSPSISSGSQTRQSTTLSR